ncbi:hypothetical protein N9K16_05580 [Alphaproteobacteria bacterium]|nr:hypothetical protein [Alphaproteobacteria bacterium]
MPQKSSVSPAEKNLADRWYNGFSPEDRALLSKPQRIERYVNGNNPLVCCMTGFSRPDDPKGNGYMVTHLEDYTKPLDWYPMSKRAHHLLHRRFVDPDPWLRFVDKHYREGAWFTLLTMEVECMYQRLETIYSEGLPAAGI